MDAEFIANLIREIGGGLPSVVILVLGWAYWQKEKQNASKDEKFIELSINTNNIVRDLTSAIRDLQRSDK